MPLIEVFYSLQSAYCYFLLDRLKALEDKGVDVVIRPILGGVMRLPERYKNRDALEMQYFDVDATRQAAFLGLPYADPDPWPMVFVPGRWVAEAAQPRNEYLHRLYVAATRAGAALPFLDHVARMIWDGSTPGWDQSDHLAQAMARASLDLEACLADTSWASAKETLDKNAAAILDAGHWGVPLMVYQDEPFYGQDRFDQLVWRMTQKGDLPY
jgi:2-hydroxychromene-2-carboxylate isomerase